MAITTPCLLILLAGAVAAVTELPLFPVPEVALNSSVGVDMVPPIVYSFSAPPTIDTSGLLGKNWIVNANVSNAISVAVVLRASDFETIFALVNVSADNYTTGLSSVCLPVGTYELILKTSSANGVTAWEAVDVYGRPFGTVTVTVACALATASNLVLPSSLNVSCNSTTWVCPPSLSFTATVSVSTAMEVLVVLAPENGLSGMVLWLTGTSLGPNPSLQLAGSLAWCGFPVIDLEGGNAMYFDVITNCVPPSGNWIVHDVMLIPTSPAAVVNNHIFGAEKVNAAGLGGRMTIINGGTDSTPPTCTSVTVDHTSITTAGVAGPSLSYSVNCTDSGGVGVSAVFLFTQAFSPTGVETFTSNIGMENYQSSSVFVVTAVPLLFEGQYRVLGVGAWDKSGNAVMYGSCGDWMSWIPSLCGTGDNTAISSTGGDLGGVGGSVGGASSTGGASPTGWSAWSECSQECGGGFSTRYCQDPSDDCALDGAYRRSKMCNTESCCGQSLASKWGNKQHLRTRYIYTCPGHCGDSAPTQGMWHGVVKDPENHDQDWYTLDSQMCSSAFHATGVAGGTYSVRVRPEFLEAESTRIRRYNADQRYGIPALSWPSTYPVVFTVEDVRRPDTALMNGKEQSGPSVLLQKHVSQEDAETSTSIALPSDVIRTIQQITEFKTQSTPWHSDRPSRASNTLSP